MGSEEKTILKEILEQLSDIQDRLDEKDYQILHITQEIDKLKSII